MRLILKTFVFIQPLFALIDFLCSLVLMHLFNDNCTPLTFKGGTLLAKVHAGFYRLSEDLDFSLSISGSANRKERSQIVKPLKETVNRIADILPMFRVLQPLSGTNESRQYNAVLGYPSKPLGNQGRILIEIGLREQHLYDPIYCHANTLLSSPFTSANIVKPFKVKCLTPEEAYAEKVRAALTRQKPAIRDFYDIEYAVKNNIVDFSDVNFIDLVKRKLSIEKLKQINISAEKRKMLHGKIASELLPTLQTGSGDTFELDGVLDYLEQYSDALAYA